MTFWRYVAAHWAVIWAFLLSQKLVIGLVITSGIRTMPTPGQPWKVYTFLYDWLHQFANINNTRLNPQPIPSPPTSAPDPANKDQSIAQK